MGRLALGALALALTAAGCGAPAADPSRTPSVTAAASPGGATSSGTTSGSVTPGTSATLIAFVMVRDAGTGGASEVSGPDQVNRLVGGPPEAVASVRAAVVRNSGAGTRLFAFVLAGCQNDGAALAIQAGRISATLTGGTGMACFAAEWYLAVFAVPARLVPPGTRVG